MKTILFILSIATPDIPLATLNVSKLFPRVVPPVPESILRILEAPEFAIYNILFTPSTAILLGLTTPLLKNFKLEPDAWVRENDDHVVEIHFFESIEDVIDQVYYITGDSVKFES